MQEVKFRGRTVNANEWVYGFYFINSSGNCIIIETIEIPPNNENPCGDTTIKYHTVSAYTVSQYTGLKNKNKKEIYGEDYLFDGKNIHRVRFVVTDYWSGFVFNGLQNITKYCETIGNGFEDNYDDLYDKYLSGEDK